MSIIESIPVILRFRRERLFLANSCHQGCVLAGIRPRSHSHRIAAHSKYLQKGGHRLRWRP